ncbi:uncharacterized protein K444DRAFT_696407 [Hyaloscypha bicolor E]|uniref:DUF6594 domain-containing protein n=1 Tax=Hyaloscypha bicolor E TaxID=1095630 RepID=A0A2J6SW93_9HELO|nr:uncharacterized protein K444DRAFT_696407 [Hyaloscypha bicolor E]PMD55039.1 hypothetical protein K444DRAFT_696407 [Hyaloscypha bicolor E]
MALELSNALHQYYTAINDFKHILNTYKQPDTARSRNIGVLLAKTFHEPRYWDSPDSLNLMDLAPTSGDGGRVDWLRARLQKLLPEKSLDASGIDRRELDRKQRSGSMTAGSAKVLQPHRLHTRHISPSVDRFARIVMAVIGGVMLLVPMIDLSFVTSRTWSLITTSLFVLSFAFALAVFSNASNQEILAVAATYTAVLVVFIVIRAQECKHCLEYLRVAAVATFANTWTRWYWENMDFKYSPKSECLENDGTSDSGGISFSPEPIL